MPSQHGASLAYLWSEIYDVATGVLRLHDRGHKSGWVFFVVTPVQGLNCKDPRGLQNFGPLTRHDERSRICSNTSQLCEYMSSRPASRLWGNGAMARRPFYKRA